MKLRVEEGFDHDTYKDTVRIHISHRKGIRSGHLARLSVKDGRSAVVAVRGLRNGQKDIIRLDLETRRRLGVEVGETRDFGLKEARWWEEIEWAAKASDPAARVATRIAIWLGAIGVGIGAIDIVLGAIQIWQGWK